MGPSKLLGCHSQTLHIKDSTGKRVGQVNIYLSFDLENSISILWYGIYDGKIMNLTQKLQHLGGLLLLFLHLNILLHLKKQTISKCAIEGVCLENTTLS